MAYRLPIAGVATELSEHFAFFTVHDKPKRKITCEVEANNQCCLSPKFLCISKSVIENRAISCERKHQRHHPCPFVEKCCSCVLKEATQECCTPVCEHVADECQCNMQKRILKQKSECCLARKQPTTRNIRCDAFSPNGGREHDKIRIIEIMRARQRSNDDHIMEKKMREKLCNLERDVQKFDLALKCMENRKRKRDDSEQCCVAHESYTITCCPKDPIPLEPCKITCRCNDPVPRKWKCYPVASRKQQCTRPFYGKTKSHFLH